MNKIQQGYWNLYWNLLLSTIFSPRFHWTFICARFRQNYITAPMYRRLIAVIFWASVLIIVLVNQWWKELIVAWVFPLTVPFQISALLQFISEHDWRGNGDSNSKSHGRFCGEAPPFGKSIGAWFGWISRMLYHFCVRVAVLPGDLPQHDWHHKSPKTQKDWSMSTYARQKEVESGAEYTEFWGLGNAIGHVLRGFVENPISSDEKHYKN